MKSSGTARCILGWERISALGAIAWVLGAGARAALDAALPPQCPSCDTIVPAPGLFCAPCFAGTGFISAPFCARCGVPFAHAGQAGRGGNCPACEATPPDFDRARAALRYDGQARGLVLAFKHADRTEHARVLAALMARAGAALLNEAELIVPVPLHRRRLFARRYNQSALLARLLARISGRPLALAALRRPRPTPALTARTATERAAVMAGAIVAAPRTRTLIADRRVLLVDDVMTSGATANACARALREAGARAVDVLVAARVPDPRLA